MQPRRVARSRVVTLADRPSVGARLVISVLFALLLMALLRPLVAAASVSPNDLAPTLVLAHRGAVATLDQQFSQSMERYRTGDVQGALGAWYSLADNGHARALYNLGVAYSRGVGVSPDDAQALFWWHRAALAGSTEAQFNLGVAYAQGHIVEKDPTLAAMWWYMAASGGDAAAQFNLGMMAAEGDGQAHDFDNAVFWWQQAAEQGFPSAIQALDVLERQGIITRAQIE